MTFFELEAVLDKDKNLTATKLSNQNQGENNCTKIVVSVPPEMCEGFQFFLEFLCPQNKRFVAEMESKGEADGMLLFACAVPSCVLQEEGLVTFQLVARSTTDDAIVYKSVRSAKSSFFVHASVNAIENAYVVEDYFAGTNGSLAQESLLREAADAKLQQAVNNVSQNVATHQEDTDNPHAVTKEQLGLDKVQNTADSEKRVFFATFAQCDEDGNNLRTYAKKTDIPTTLPSNGGNADTVGGKSATDFATAAQGVKAETAYQKPSDGIPASHLSADAQSALNLAQTAVQSLNGYATENFVKEKVASLVNSAPEALDTLNELAQALGNDANFATTVSAELGKKANLSGGNVFVGVQTMETVNANQYNDGSGTSLMNNGGGSSTQIGSSSRPTRIYSSTQPTWYKNGTLQGVLALKTDVPSNYAGSSSAGGSATSAAKLDTATAGSATQPVYFSGGKPTPTTYTLGANVPIDAKFTDTTYTAATQSAAGLMSISDKKKLDGIAQNANNYTLPVASASTLGGITASDDGDITIDENGVVSVKDNSHAHIMSDIENLQVTLNSKVNKTVLEAYVKKSDESQEITAKSLSTVQDVSGRDALFDRVVASSYYVGTGATNLLVQSTGQSTSQVMSQQATTQALGNLQTYFEQYVDEEIEFQLEEALGDVNSVLDAINGEVK